MSKTLVAYFSASGVTRAVAKSLAAAADADLFEIEAAPHYSEADVNWRDKNSRASRENADPSARPEIAKKVTDMGQYDVVYLGYPIWWGGAPRIINSFLESYDFEGKLIIPFATSGGSSLGRSGDVLREASAPKATWLKGKLLNGNPSVSDLKAWTDSVK